MVRLTQPQQAVYSYIKECILARGYGPTVREIGEHMEIKSPNGVMCHLRALERKGVIYRSANKKRAIELAEPLLRAENQWEIRASASAGTVSQLSQPYQSFRPTTFFGSDNIFLIEVRDDELRAAQLYQGDRVVIRGGNLDSIGQIALVNPQNGKSWFLGRCLTIAPSIQVHPLHQASATMRIAPEDVIGVAVGIIRML